MNDKNLYIIVITLLIATITMLGFMIYGNYRIEKALHNNYIVPLDNITECTTDIDCELKNN